MIRASLPSGFIEATSVLLKSKLRPEASLTLPLFSTPCEKTIRPPGIRVSWCGRVWVSCTPKPFISTFLESALPSPSRSPR